MGRPVKKSLLSQIKVRAKVGSNAEGDGSIVSQRTTNKFKVTVGSNTDVCKLVDKAEGALGSNEMTIEALTDGGVRKRVAKLFNRTAVFFDGTRQMWNFGATLSDGAAQIQQVGSSDFYAITIGTQPADTSIIEGETATFTAAATVAPSGTATYQWQLKVSGGTTFSNIAGATSATYTTSARSLANDGDQYRVVVSATNADSVTSSVATLTVTAA